MDPWLPLQAAPPQGPSGIRDNYRPTSLYRETPKGPGSGSGSREPRTAATVLPRLHWPGHVVFLEPVQYLVVDRAAMMTARIVGGQ